MPITMQVPVIFTNKGAAADNDPKFVNCAVKGSTSDEELQLIREMGIENVDLNLDYASSNYVSLTAILNRLDCFGLKAGNLSCMPLQKNKLIDLGLEGRDKEIEKFNAFVELANKVNVPIVSVAWQPNGILRSGRTVLPTSHGGISGYVDMNEINQREAVNGRVYSKEEIWDNFAYFLKKVLPVCEANGVRIVLHPNDPPVSCLAGVGSLIDSTADYNHAFKLANESKALAMKMCIGCWLEGGDSFGDLMNDIEDFTRRDKIAVVHFRNVSSTLPYFEETLAEDGYADMYQIMKQFVKCGYHGLMSVDHVFDPHDKNGNHTTGYAYPTGYAKGLLHAAESELGLRK